MRSDSRGSVLNRCSSTAGSAQPMIRRTMRSTPAAVPASGSRVVWAETVRLPEAGTAAGVERIVRRIIGCALPAVDEHLFKTLPRESDRIYDRYLRAKRT